MIRNSSMRRVVCLEKVEAVAAGRTVRYYLYVRRRLKSSRYCIRVRMGREDVTAVVGERLDGAVSLFCKLVKGTVTPCTLRDIVQDFNSFSME